MASSRAIRLTIVFTAVWSCVLLGLLFVCRIALQQTERANADSLLTADWNTLKGYLKIERGRPFWYADYDDLDERATVARLRKSFRMVDGSGTVLELSPAAADLESSQPMVFASVIQEVERSGATFSTAVKDSNGKPFLLLCGQLRDETGSQKYYASIGRPLSFNHRFFTNWALLVLLAVSLSAPLSAVMVRVCARIDP